MPYHVLVCYPLETAESTELTVGAFLLVRSEMYEVLHHRQSGPRWLGIRMAVLGLIRGPT